MTQTQQPDLSLEDFLKPGTVPTDARHWLAAAYEAPDPMARVGAALCGLLGTIVEQADPTAALPEEVREQLAERERMLEQIAQLESVQLHLDGVLDEILEVCGKSRAAALVKIREIITASRAPKASAPEPEPAAVPAADASVETWREYAVSQGQPMSEVVGANRSQIRTLLGLSHSGTAE